MILFINSVVKYVGFLLQVLKLYGWEKSFIGQILGIRQKEIVVLKKTAWMSAFINFIWVSIPFLVALASFTTYVFIDGGQVLDANRYKSLIISTSEVTRIGETTFPNLFRNDSYRRVCPKGSISC